MRNEEEIREFFARVDKEIPLSSIKNPLDCGFERAWRRYQYQKEMYRVRATDPKEVEKARRQLEMAIAKRIEAAKTTASSMDFAQLLSNAEHRVRAAEDRALIAEAIAEEWLDPVDEVRTFFGLSRLGWTTEEVK